MKDNTIMEYEYRLARRLRKVLHMDCEVKMEWISIFTALPEVYQFVLVYSKKLGCEPSPMSIARWDGEFWQTLCNENENNACACGDLFWATGSEEITHWMPLPKPPGEE
jgi:hypothetical protein